MKNILQFLIVFFVSCIMVNCGEDTYPYIHITQTEFASIPELTFGTVTIQKTFGICNWGTGTLSWTISEDLNWLETDKISGSSVNDTTIITVTVDREGLDPGVYKGSILVTGNNDDISISITMVVTTLGTFIDHRDNREYNWVKIGEQIWMSENLAYLPEISPPTDGSNIEPYYYVLNYEGNDISEAKATDNFNSYGVLYNWPAAMEASPEGWHLPTEKEWEQLIQYVNTQMGPFIKDDYGLYGLGKHLNYDETNDFGFSGLITSGYHYRYSNNLYDFGNINGHWWSATDEPGMDYAWGCVLQGWLDFLNWGYGAKDSGFSVRCIKNQG